jgi:hypothetical protein
LKKLVAEKKKDLSKAKGADKSVSKKAKISEAKKSLAKAVRKAKKVTKKDVKSEAKKLPKAAHKGNNEFKSAIKTDNAELKKMMILAQSLN